MRVVIVDEVQKVPALLDEAHRLIEADPDVRFVLTGSSARKLRREGVNLLAGRAARRWLHPLVHPERSSDPNCPVSIAQVLQWGALPAVLRSTDPRGDLLDYSGVYLQEEIRAEGLARKFDAFARFLDFAATTHGEQVVYANVARDIEVPPRTVREYYGVLEDTLVGHLVPAFRGTPSRKAAATEKFFFFDAGVAHALLGRFNLTPAAPEYGKAFEHLVWRELRSAVDYLALDARVCFWRTLSGLEVDFIVERRGTPLIAIEVKAADHVSLGDLKGLRAFGEDHPAVRRLVVCSAPFVSALRDGTEVWPIAHFYEELWAGRLIPPAE